ncbi:carboxypeptidase-like regulatory domain-containing protein, partial [Bacteroides cellulosilyticus]
MKRIIWLFLLSLVTILSFAQSFKGTVTDTDGKPVPYAALYLREMKSGLTTDDHGRFQTKLSAGQYTCEVSSLGFISQTFTFQMLNRDYEKDIVLAERTYSLPEVNITKGNEDPAYAV